MTFEEEIIVWMSTVNHSLMVISKLLGEMNEGLNLMNEGLVGQNTVLQEMNEYLGKIKK